MQSESGHAKVAVAYNVLYAPQFRHSLSSTCLRAELFTSGLTDPDLPLGKEDSMDVSLSWRVAFQRPIVPGRQ